MSFNFSGMFGGGFTNNLNKNNFNFSAYAPQKEEVVVDPIDIVSNNTPEAKVEVLEGAADVAVTKQPEVRYSTAATNAMTSLAPTTPDLTEAPADPIDEAIQSVQPKTIDLGMDFGVTPETAVTDLSNLSSLNPQYSEAPDAISETGTYQSWENSPNLAASGTGFDVNLGQPDLYYDEEGVLQAEEKKDTPLSTYFDQKQTRFDDTTSYIDSLKSNTFTSLGVAPPKDALFGKGKSNTVNYEFVSFLNDMLKSDNASMYADTMTKEASSFFGESDDGYQTNYNAMDYLKDLGIAPDKGGFEVPGKYGGYSVYDYDENTNQFVKTEDKESTFIDAALPQIRDGLVMYVLTAGIGNAIGDAYNLGAVGQGVTTAGTNAAVQQLMTGEVDLVQAALAGLAAGAEAANAAAQSSMLAATTPGASAAVKAGADVLTAQAEIWNNVSTGVDVVTAIENNNFLASFDLVSEMLGSPTLVNTIIDKLSGVVASDYLDLTASTIVNAADAVIGGGDVEDVFQSAANDIVKNSIATEDNIKNTFNFEGAYADAAIKTIKALTDKVLDGEDKEGIIGAGLEAFLDNLPEDVQESGDASWLETWYHENIENRLEQFWQDIEPLRDGIEGATQGAIDTAVEIGRGVAEAGDAFIRFLPTTKQDWKDLEQWTKDNIPDVDLPDVDLPDISFPDIDLPDIDVPDIDLPDIDLPDIDVPDAPELPDIPDAPDLPEPPSVSIDPEITQERRGFYYDDSGLVSNPFLRDGEQGRIKNLTDMIQIEQEKSARQAKILADEEERKLRYKSVFGVNPNVQVKYNG